MPRAPSPKATPAHPHRHPHPHPANGSPRPRDVGETIVGLRAGLALLARRPDAVQRVAFSRRVEREVEPALQRLRARGVPCVAVPDRELERIAGTAQHEGLCVAALARAWASPQDVAERLARVRGTAIALDRVRNPYNIGAILRTAAFFGLDAAIVGAPAPHPGLDPNAVRVAEGGAEELTLSRTTDLKDTLARLRKAGVRVVAADQAAPVDARDYPFPRPCVLVMGNEREGLAPRVREECDATVAIRGGGAVESLNVAVAAGILIAQLARQRA